MLDRFNALRALPFLGVLGVAVASCSGSDPNGGIDYGGNGTPAGLVSMCDKICANVVGMCAPATNLLGPCLDACGDLNLLPASCLNPFLSYVTCVAGATQVQCGDNGASVLITPQQCESARDQTLNCNASPGLVTACVALPGSTACAAPGVEGTNPVFCVGAPDGCAAPSANPLGIGVYCCD
jgi:hypothetical protein